MEKLKPEELLALVRDTPLLSPLPEPELLKLLADCRQILLPAGEALCREGEEGRGEDVGGPVWLLSLGGTIAVSRGIRPVGRGLRTPPAVPGGVMADNKLHYGDNLDILRRIHAL